MFGMGFLEIFLILVVAVIALGPEKLPNAAVDIAKMIRKLKANVDDVKSSMDSELNLSGMKSEAEKFKDSMGIDKLASLDIKDILEEDDDVYDEDIPYNEIKKENKQDKKIKKENKKDKKIKASYTQTTEPTLSKKDEEKEV